MTEPTLREATIAKIEPGKMISPAWLAVNPKRCTKICGSRNNVAKLHKYEAMPTIDKARYDPLRNNAGETNGSEAVRIRQTNRASAATPNASATQECSVKNSSNPVVPTATNIAPRVSNAPRTGCSLGMCRRKSGTSNKVNAVTTNKYLQPKYSTIAPPATGPRPRPNDTADIIKAIALPRRSMGT
ncbi:hypothetical protein D3C81_819400 [compost metagenome]